MQTTVEGTGLDTSTVSETQTGTHRGNSIDVDAAVKKTQIATEMDNVAKEDNAGETGSATETEDAAHTEEPPVHYFDVAGNLPVIVNVNGTKVVFMACSRTLARNSPSFKWLLAEDNPSFPNQKKEGAAKLTLDLQAESWEAVNLVFALIHQPFNKINDSLSITQLYNLLRFTRKYEMTPILRQYCRKWVEQLTPWENLPPRGEATYQWLFIAWETGHSEAFFGIGNKITSQVNKERLPKILEAINSMWLCEFSPDTPLVTFAEDVTNARLDKIRALFSLVEESMQDLLTSDPNNHKLPKVCRGDKDAGICESLMLGSCQRALYRQGIYPAPVKIDDYDKNAEQLEKAIRDVIPLSLAKHPKIRSVFPGHPACFWYLPMVKDLETATKSIQFAHSDAYAEYLGKQAKLTGLA